MLFRFDYPNVWDALKTSKKPIVLYGMGNGADKVLDEMEKRGITAAGVMASDDFVRYQDYRGFTVKKQSDLENELGDFLVALCFASALPDVTAHIRKVASEHELLVPNVPVVGDAIMDADYLAQHKAEIEKAFSLLADDRSKAVFKGALDFFYTGRLPYLDLIDSDKDEAFASHPPSAKRKLPRPRRVPRRYGRRVPALHGRLYAHHRRRTESQKTTESCAITSNLSETQKRSTRASPIKRV